MNKRVWPVIKVLILFVVFSLVSFALILLLFKLAFFALPFLAFMWTFFWFEVFYAITLKKIKIRYKLLFASGSFFYVYVFLSTLICISLVIDSSEKVALIILIVNGILFVPITVFFICFIIKLFRKYFPIIKNKIQSFFKK